MFGNKLASESPVSAAAIRAQHQAYNPVHYVDRYLLTPLTMRLLFEVLRTICKGAGPSQHRNRSAGRL